MSRYVRLFVVLPAVACATLSTPATAQENPRRQFVEGLLRSLIDSQLPRSEPNRPRNPPRQAASPELQRVQAELQQFAARSGQLVRQLHVDARSNNAARYLLGDAITLSADATRLANQSRAARQIQPLNNSFRALDRDWRTLSHQLHRISSLSRECAREIDFLDQRDAVLCELFDVPPQVNYRALSTECDTLSVELHHLAESLEHRAHRGRRQSRPGGLAVQALRIEQQVRRFCDLVFERRPYETTVSAWQDVHRQWQRLAGPARELADRNIELDLRRVERAIARIHEILWLPQPIDYGQLAHLNQVMAQDVDELFNVVTLNTLMEMPSARGLLQTANEFYGLCEHFETAIASRETLPELQSDFAYLTEAWPQFESYFRNSRDNRIADSLSAIEDSFITLRDALGVRPQFAWPRAANILAACDQTCRRMHADLERYLIDNPRYRSEARGAARSNARALENSIKSLQAAVSRKDAEQARRYAGHLAADWSRLRDGTLRQLQAGDAERFRNHAASLTRNVVQLQTLFLP